MAANELSEKLFEISNVVDNCTDKPEQFLGVQNDVAKALCDVTKRLYDLTKSLEPHGPGVTDALTELIVEGFDDEQVWQELELQNDPCLVGCLTAVSQASASTSLQFANDEKHKSESLNLLDEENVDDGNNVGDDDTDNSDNEEHTENDELDVEESSEDEDDALLFDGENGDSDMSDEDREMIKLLEKARAVLPVDGESDSDDDDIDAAELGDIGDALSGSKAKKKQSTIKVPPEDKEKVSEKSGAKKKGKLPGRSTIDDNFFQLNAMEDFLDQEDAKENRKHSGNVDRENESSDEDVDYFADIPSDGEDEIKYEDFFDPPDGDDMVQTTKKEQKKVKFQTRESEVGEDDAEDDRDEESSEGEDVSEILGGSRGQQSSFQKRQERVKEKITEMEEDALKEKDWQLKGEVGASARPENSLLQEDLDFDHTTRLAPVITEETTKSLEDMIKQRIKDKAFDDVERKEKRSEDTHQYKKRVVLDQEKSKLSLGEIYEQEYQKLQQKDETEEKDPAHADIEKSLQALFVKLDALSNFHYTPKPAAPDIKIVSNLPSIAMEEVAPVSVSDAMMLAPEEIQEKQKGELKGSTEKSDTDRKRERREKKLHQREKHQRREAKQKALEEKGLGTKQAKDKAMKELEKQSKSGRGVNIIKDDKTSKKSGLTSSNQFFTQLQEEVTTHIRSKKGKKTKQKAQDTASAVKFKL